MCKRGSGLLSSCEHRVIPSNIGSKGHFDALAALRAPKKRRKHDVQEITLKP